MSCIVFKLNKLSGPFPLKSSEHDQKMHLSHIEARPLSLKNSNMKQTNKQKKKKKTRKSPPPLS